MDERRIMLVGGGSGGHFYPLIAIAEALQTIATANSSTLSLYYIGPTPYDDEALKNHAIRYLYCPAGKQRKYRSLLNFFDVFKVVWGFFVAFVVLLRIYPDVIMSKGSYTSVPVVFAAWILRIPIVIHESDAVPGTANKIGSKFAQYIATSYPDTDTHFPKEKILFTGIPIRHELLQERSQDAQLRIGVNQNRPTLLVLGGSQGAERVNNLILETLDELLPTFNVIHQTGEHAYDATTQTARALITDAKLLAHYHPTPFLDVVTLNDAMHVAAIVISRAGSTSIYEIAIHGKPAILIPIPEEISHDQRTNAYAYARTEAAIVMEEKNLTDGLLTAEINRIMGDQNVYNHMCLAAQSFGTKEAGLVIATRLVAIADEHYS